VMRRYKESASECRSVCLRLEGWSLDYKSSLPPRTNLLHRGHFMKNMHLARFFAVCMWISFISALALGQVTSRVTGVVRDPQGALVSGANVTLTNEATGVSFATTTSQGSYVFDAVKPGTYSIRV